jgi:uncharacterized damage-inducible protein DinB
MPDTFLTPAQFLDHWQGHRRLTRRFIAAYPEKELFAFSVGGMRPFAELVTEQRWDETTAEINRLFPTIPVERFQVQMKAFGMWDFPGYGLLLYIIDNEIHHRAQASVYLRALGVEPPFFPDRS